MLCIEFDFAFVQTTFCRTCPHHIKGCSTLLWEKLEVVFGVRVLCVCVCVCSFINYQRLTNLEDFREISYEYHENFVYAKKA